MISDDERREVARRLRSLVTDDSVNATVDASYVLHVLGLYYADIDRIYFCGYDVARLADLIEPTDGFDLDTVQRVCFECMEGCDEPEWTLYTTIHDAIARYKRGESGPTYDRDTLLAPAEEMVEAFRLGAFTGEGLDAKWCRELHDKYADRIREALGETRD